MEQSRSLLNWFEIFYQEANQIAIQRWRGLDLDEDFGNPNITLRYHCSGWQSTSMATSGFRADKVLDPSRVLVHDQNGSNEKMNLTGKLERIGIIGVHNKSQKPSMGYIHTSFDVYDRDIALGGLCFSACACRSSQLAQSSSVGSVRALQKLPSLLISQ
jgi:hypothetical protein